jgi:hypothetical protein
MSDLAQELGSVSLFLQRVSIIGCPDDVDLAGHDLPLLALALRGDEIAMYYYRGAGGQPLDRAVIRQRVLGNDLQTSQRGTIVQLNKREVLGVAPCSDPALNSDGGSGGGPVEKFLYRARQDHS